MAEDDTGAEPRTSAEAAGLDKDGARDTSDAKGGAAAGGKPKGKMADHKEVIIMIATVVGVIIAWIAYKRQSGAASGVSSYTPSASTLGSGTVAGDPGTGTGTDATAGLAARLDRENELLRTLNNTLRHPSAPPPAGHQRAHFIFGAAAKGLRYIRDRATGVIYQINPNGSAYKLSSLQYTELGHPKVTGAYGRPPKSGRKPGNGRRGHGKNTRGKRPVIPTRNINTGSQAQHPITPEHNIGRR